MVVEGSVSGSGLTPLGTGRLPSRIALASVLRNGAEGGMV
jgi:hypothetical protein